MKKTIFTLLIGGLMMTGLSAKTAVVYFSATGTTERMAHSAQAVAVDLVAAEVICQSLRKAWTLRVEKTLPAEVAPM